MGKVLCVFTVPATFDADALAARVAEQIGEPCALTCRDGEAGMRIGELRCEALVETASLCWQGDRLHLDVDDVYFELHLERALLALGATPMHGRSDTLSRFPRLDRRWRDLRRRDRLFRSSEGARVRRVIGIVIFPLYAAVEIAIVFVMNLIYLPLCLVRRLLGRPR